MVKREDYIKSLKDMALAWFDVNADVRFYVMKGGNFALVDRRTCNIISLDKASLENLAKILAC